MSFTTRTRNALIGFAWDQGWRPEWAASYEYLHEAKEERELELPPRGFIAKFTSKALSKQPEMGKLGLRDVASWLAEEGLSFATDDGQSKRPTITRARIDDAIELLQRLGYTVTPPDIDVK